MNPSRVLAGLALGLFALSLFLPSVNGMWGIVAVVFGVAAVVFDPPWFFVWLANPLVVATFWLRMKGTHAVWQRILPLVAAACALYALQAESIVIEESGAPHLVALHAGYWLWLAGIGFTALASLVEVGHGAPEAEPQSSLSESVAS